MRSTFAKAPATRPVAHRGSVVCTATASSSRRQALAASFASLVLVPTFSAQSRPESSLCTEQDTAEAGTECREAVLRADGGKQESYGSATTSQSRKLDVVGNVPVATLDSEYARDTKDLVHHIRDYISIDVYNKGRVPLIKEIKADGASWVSKYARGGSARALSARKMYIAVDSVFGHLASAGLAPLPPNKAKTVLATLEEVTTFLKEGR